MEAKLSVIKPLLLQKRIKKEIDHLVLLNMCDENEINVTASTFDYVIRIKNIVDKHYYEFKVTNNFPFTPPNIHINKKPLIFNHGLNNTAYSDALKKYTGIKCFCCETILCRDNWSPAFTFKHILDDIEKYKHANRQVVNRAIIDVIKRKYLIDDINIVEWLY
jgi:ubiquitin-protein ligase